MGVQDREDGEGVAGVPHIPGESALVGGRRRGVTPLSGAVRAAVGVEEDGVRYPVALATTPGEPAPVISPLPFSRAATGATMDGRLVGEVLPGVWSLLGDAPVAVPTAAFTGEDPNAGRGLRPAVGTRGGATPWL